MKLIGPNVIGPNVIGPNVIGPNVFPPDGVPWPYDFEAPAYFFDGVNQEARNGSFYSTVITGATSVGLGIWVKMTSSPANPAIISSAWVGSNLTGYSLSVGTDGAVQARAAGVANEANNAATRYEVTSPAGTLVVGSWIFLWVFISTTDVRLFVNGTSVGTPITTKPAFIGAGRTCDVAHGGGQGVHNGSGTTSYFPGFVRDFSITRDEPIANIGNFYQQVGSVIGPANLTTTIPTNLFQWFRSGPGDAPSNYLNSAPANPNGFTVNAPAINDTGASDLLNAGVAV